MFLDGNEFSAGFHFNKIETRRDDIIEVLQDKLGFAIADIIKNFMNQSFDAIDIFNDDLAEQVNEFGIISSSRCKLNECLDGSQRIPNLMCKATGYGLERAQSICAAHQNLRSLEVGIQHGV